MVRRMGLFSALVLCLALLPGCLFRPVEDLYRLPERFPGYESLTEEISRVKEELRTLGSSVEYAPIFSGDHTATIQLHDLDGDGARESALVFFRVPGAERPIKVYILAQDEQGNYRVGGVVEGEGTGIYAIDFVDINGRGNKELAISWQTSRGVNQLGLYCLDDQPRRTEAHPAGLAPATWEDPALQATELLLTGYSGYSLLDIDQNGRIEAAVARVDTAGTNSHLELYAWEEGAVVGKGTVVLSTGITNLNKMTANFILDYIPALYLTSTLADGGKATDVVRFRSGQLVNLSLDPETGVSRHVLRDYGDVGPTDINRDSILELPWPSPLPTYGAETVTNFWLLDWSQYDGDGNDRAVHTTYHNVSDGWYFIIPEHWRDQLTVSRNDTVSGQRAVVFSRWRGPGEEPEDFLAIYRLTGPNRFTRATLNNRFQLEDDASTIYAATFFPGSWDCGLTQADVINNFNRIISSWSGD